MKFLIFGKAVEISIDQKLQRQNKIDIQTNFSLYPILAESRNSDIHITICNEFENIEIISQNPSVHQEITHGFIAKFLKYDLAYQLIDGRLWMQIKLKTTDNKILRYLKRINNIEYENIEGRISGIIHEMVLVPATYFFDDLTLVHCSTFTKAGKAIMVGGTGGSGKTSLSIELCMNRGYKFVNDDIAVVDKTGKVYPNLAFPKIYGYNLTGNWKLEKMIFQNRSLIDKLIWKIKYLLLGANKVRRKISPESAFGSYQKEPVKLTGYYILSRVNETEIKFDFIESGKAAEITSQIIQQEYFNFNNHILWHEVNCKLNGTEPVLKLTEIQSKMNQINHDVMNGFFCKTIKIPIKIDHAKYISEVTVLIEKDAK